MTTTLSQPTTTATPTSEATTAVVTRVRNGFKAGRTRPISWRISQLDALAAMLKAGADELTKALHADLGKSATEAWSTEIGFTLADIKQARSNLAKWVKPQKASIPLFLRPGKGRIAAEPLGTVLVLAPWNYPVQLLISPMVAAIAAGNAVVAKPSELAPATSAVLVELAAEYLDAQAIAVVGGGVAEATALLTEQFDHIFFTGSTNVGKIVMQAAAKHLTPVTLELGGKSPAIIANDANLEVAARWIAFGKFLNAGQTCVAPDYVLISHRQRGEFVRYLGSAITEFYGDDPHTSGDYGRIVSDRHHQRLFDLMSESGAGTVAIGGSADVADRYFAPTVLIDTELDATIMAEEIFGPILPVLVIESVDAAIDFVKSRPKPLALYLFTENQDTIDDTLAQTSSGGVGINTTILQLSAPDLPFGGVGASGMGTYHGKAGFDTFSHFKSVYARPIKPELSIMYPPYTKLKQHLIRRAN